MRHTRLGWAAFVAVALTASAYGVDLDVDLDVNEADIERTLRVARDPDVQRARFHAPYITTFDDATAERVEVVTETRRMVLLAEERIRAGDHAFSRSLRLAREALAPFKRRVSIVARYRFSPMNTYQRAPAVDVTLGIVPDSVRPLEVKRGAIYGFTSGPDSSAPVVEATVEAVFDAVQVGQARREVILWFGSKDVARTAIDFAKLD